jgi:ribosome-binding protein aMBF1 (putative translation factor)
VKTICYNCGGEIKNYSNQGCKTLCPYCTDKRVKTVFNLEHDANMDILTMNDYVQALEVVATADAKKSMCRELKRAREAKGWSQRILAAHLGVSAPLIWSMESGRKRLNNKALRFIEETDY